MKEQMRSEFIKTIEKEIIVYNSMEYTYPLKIEKEDFEESDNDCHSWYFTFAPDTDYIYLKHLLPIVITLMNHGFIVNISTHKYQEKKKWRDQLVPAIHILCEYNPQTGEKIKN